ncbi:FadR family transcriptional regulator [Actinosynnema pretiosum subsp. pretiosum]|uniref:GntR domain protein n=3 Tax=Actinosynnema TaxID=40566 RepID=C6WER4_ACTMD|nr:MULTISPECIES: FadR/GntR family transcriptional regulator [Actinosynnema]ACU39689.1 GntR domain protein [Actinosynnema mirum DSM 43827]ATE56801.1 FadR family transcriptional regulator [Actinosynnema pretiosum]QUF02967.1 FadR family transcriptional regulator [Actinosynnema pretiosum subsp. pretiosum]
MPLATTRRAGLVDQVIDQMRGAIASGEWPVGRRIPPEPELVTALGVGRNTVREAVRALAHAGLLEVRQGDGTFVRATSELSGAVRRLCGSELRDVLQVRRTLEVEGARLAATQRTEEELARLEVALAERDSALAAKDWERLVERDAQFHELLLQCSHNTLLAELYQGLTEAVRASIDATVRTAPDDDDLSHEGLLQAIRDADPARAALEAGGFLEELLERHGE